MRYDPRVFGFGLVAAAVLATACVDGRMTPDIIPQAELSYGPNVYLVDDTRLEAASSRYCSRLGEIVATASTATVTVMARDDKEPVTLDPTIPHNCFVRAVPKTLKIDQVEVTNDLFQLCVDSGACERPNPSKGSKNQICNDDSRFEECPVVEVPIDQADTFCKWIGRRLPTGIEHIIMRQATATDTQNPENLPVFPNGGLDEQDDAPTTCEDAVLGANNCLKPRPMTLEPGKTVGGAPMDAVPGDDGTLIYDLTGNVSEWAADLIASKRGDAESLPWFCSIPLPGWEANTMSFPAGATPTCPAGEVCVYGQFQPPGLTIGVYPVCITNPSGRFFGEIGSLFGGSYRDKELGREEIGVFGRRAEPSPRDLQDTGRAREFGFRCVGDKTVGADFDDVLELSNP